MILNNREQSTVTSTAIEVRFLQNKKLKRKSTRRNEKSKITRELV